ncbi:hypothetical protein OF83DRAFT_935818 [Amylostereum chailletii]|nr:hypothetical protein OF83DRAFT_935818 [Amylostereum chailletii]
MYISTVVEFSTSASVIFGGSARETVIVVTRLLRPQDPGLFSFIPLLSNSRQVLFLYFLYTLFLAVVDSATGPIKNVAIKRFNQQ